jgi:outer membrane protein OmpA-like peptidoglycan-associated protein/tetratricopeptide (TPR) repeat protein
MIFLFGMFCITVQLSAQTSNVEFREKNFAGRENEFKQAFDAYKKGDYYFLRGPVYFPQALEFYLKAQDFNPNNADLNYQIGLCYLSLQVDRLQSLPYLERARMLNSELGTEFLFSLGNAYQYNLEFDQAIRVYDAYIQALGENPDARRKAHALKSMEECRSGIELVKKPVRVRIDNLGPGVNSKFPDYAPVLSSDENKLIFTSRRENTTGGMVDEQDSLFFEDIYITYNIDGEWAPAKNIGKPINKDDHDASINLSADGKKLLIYRPKNGGDIFESTLEGISWSEPRAMKEINTRGYENHATYSPDGRYLFFIAVRTDSSGYGGKDIYIAEIDDQGNASNIRNAGSVINTPYDEDGVFFHPDGKTLNFSSKGHSTMGGFDVFKTTWENETFGTPANLGYPINSPEDDVFFVLSKDGKRAYFSSYREEGFGDKDIYVMNFLDDAELLSSLQFSIRDTSNEKPVLAKISIRDVATGELMVTRETENGETLANLPAGKTYEITVNADRYNPYTEVLEIPLDAGSQVVMRKVEMSKSPQAFVSGSVADRSSRIPVRSELEFLDAGTMEVVKGCVTDKTGEYKITLPPGRAYMIRVKASGYSLLADSLLIAASSKGEELFKSFKLNRLDKSYLSILKGRIFDAATGEVLNAKVNLTEFGGQPVLMYYKPGTYDCMVTNGALLSMVVNLEGYMTYTAQIILPEMAGVQEIVHDIPLVHAEKGAKIVLNDIFFDFNKSTLRPNSYKSLNALLTTLKRYPSMTIEISGHTDNVGTMDYNQRLSDNRSSVVKEYLVRNGISAKRIGAYGRSFRQPIASNDSALGRQLNRRTEIKILRMN